MARSGYRDLLLLCHGHSTLPANREHLTRPVNLVERGKPVSVAIGRALQPFPRSKRSRHVSAHSAFQLGLSTREGRIRRCRRRGAPASKGRHLLSSPHPLTSILTGLPWRSFTLSWPLQPGIGLLRRLRPPSRTLAFSRPTKVGQTVLEFPSSHAGADSVP